MAMPTFSIAVLGFNRTEQIVLRSIFALSSRRVPSFVEVEGNAVPDIYLVDASAAEHVENLQLRNPNRRVPSILIGDDDRGTGWPALPRPIQWARLFKAFDTAIESIAPKTIPPVPADFQPVARATNPFERTVPGMAPQAPVAVPVAGNGGVAASASTIPPGFERPAARGPMPAEFAPVAQRAPQPMRAEVVQPAPAPVAAPPPAVVEAAVAPVEWVLVVDDNVTVREFMAQKLAPFRFKVDYADSGEKALFMASQRHYTCVFLDVVMEGMDGYQVCKHLKARKTPRKTHVVLLTSRGSPFDRIRGTMAGSDAYLTKPVSEEKLYSVIAKFIPSAGAA